MRPVVFLGPSLPVEEARGILDAVYLPPVRQADILSAIDRYRPKTIAIIDGVFLQDLSVWHKEILWALDQGIAVHGASSMGALRAAELDAFGMRGTGWIYRQFAEGVLTDDDEVALAHTPAEGGYEKLSEPLVNVRATLLAARDAGVIDHEQYAEAVAGVKAVYFPERTLDRIFEAWQTTPALAPVLAALQTRFAESYVDAKRNDAMELLRALAASADERPNQEPPDAGRPMIRSASFEVLYNRDRRTSRAGTEVSLADIARHAALHVPSFESLRFHASNRTLTALFGRILGLTPSAAEVDLEIRRFRLSRGLGDEAAFVGWLRANDLLAEELRSMMTELAGCRCVHRWWLSVAGGDGERIRVILDELRLSSRYPEVADEAARCFANTASDDSPATVPDPAKLADAVREHAAATGFRIAMPLGIWAREAGFMSLDQLQHDLRRSRDWRAGNAASMSADGGI